MLLLTLQPPCYEADNPAGAVDFLVADSKTAPIAWLVGLSDIKSRPSDKLTKEAYSMQSALRLTRPPGLPFPDNASCLFAQAELESKLLQLLLEVCLAFVFAGEYHN